jgi:hypothetical protein
VQNTVLLFRLAEAAQFDAPIWIDVNEIIRTAHGFPIHILQMPSILDDYRAAGRIAINPLRDTGGILAVPLRSIGAAGAAHIGIAGASGVSDEFLDFLNLAGFRRFSAPTTVADLVGVRLARLSRE